nr:ATP-binding cassette family protein [Cytophagales bacterium]
ARRDKNNVHQRQSAQLRDREQQLDGENALLARKEKQLLDAIAKHDFDSIEALREVMLDEATETELRHQKETLDAAIGQLEGAWQQTDQTLRQRRANPLTTQGYEEIAVRLAAEQRELETAIAETARLAQIRERHAATVRSNAETEAAIARQRNEHARWKALDQLIGSSRGDEFNKFAQGLTLAQLVQLANRYLDQLNTRYQIQRTPHTDLELEILDRDQADNIRPVKTLSGGETFLVSLALALGLSDIAGRKTRIESLFIDEGFGTLDPNALDTAITTLENLQATGKMIGIISHVEALKDRITTQVQVVRQPGGNSTIRING